MDSLKGFMFVIFLSTATAVVTSIMGGNAVFHIKVPDSFMHLPSISVAHSGIQQLMFTVTPSNKVTPYNNMYRYRISDILQDGEVIHFTLHNIAKTDGGNYDCLDRRRYEIPGCRDFLVITRKPFKPEIENLGNGSTYSNIVLKCKSTSRSFPSNHNLKMIYKWMRNNQEISSSNNTVVNGSVISVKNLHENNTGDVYTCQAEEHLGLKSEWSEPFIINPESPPLILMIGIPIVVVDAIAIVLIVVIVAKCKPNTVTTKPNSANSTNQEPYIPIAETVQTQRAEVHMHPTDGEHVYAAFN